MNILELLRSRGLTPVHVSAAKGGEWACPCPHCGGKDRFHVWPEQDGGPLCVEAGASGTWWCRGENKGGDMLAYLTEIERMDFAAACRELKIKTGSRQNLRLPTPPKSHQAPAWEPKTHALPSQVWRERAARLVERCHAALLAAPRALAWLAARGLDELAVRRYRLGYLAEEKPGTTGIIRPRSAWGLEPKDVHEDGTIIRKTRLWIPRGIVIPAFGSDELPIRIRIRRPKDDCAPKGFGDKYMVIEGSGMAPLHLGAQGSAQVVVEAELDAMLVHHLAGDLPGGVGALAVLTNLGKPDAEAHAALGRSLSVLVALDYDKAGADGWAWWRGQYRHARRWPTPTGKDPGDMFAAGEDIRLWIQAGLPPAFRLPQRPAAPVPAPAPAPAPAPLGAPLSGAPQCEGEGEVPAQEQAPAPRPASQAITADQRRALQAVGRFLARTGIVFGPTPRGHRAWLLPSHLTEDQRMDLMGRLLPLIPEDVYALILSHPAETVTAENILHR